MPKGQRKVQLEGYRDRDGKLTLWYHLGKGLVTVVTPADRLPDVPEVRALLIVLYYIGDKPIAGMDKKNNFGILI